MNVPLNFDTDRDRGNRCGVIELYDKCDSQLFSTRRDRFIRKIVSRLSETVNKSDSAPHCLPLLVRLFLLDSRLFPYLFIAR